MASIEVRNLTKRFGGIMALDDIELRVPNGSFVVLLGPTGAGKTTLLRLIAGLEKPDEGHVIIDDMDCTQQTPAERNVAMVFQQYSLYPHMSVRENLAFPLMSRLLSMSESEINLKVNSIAETLKIDHKLSNKATELSGGEMQRVAIGRALVRNPNIYLMDEPLSSLDDESRMMMHDLLRTVRAHTPVTTLHITHNIDDARRLADRVFSIGSGSIRELETDTIVGPA